MGTTFSAQECRSLRHITIESAVEDSHVSATIIGESKVRGTTTYMAF